MKPYVLVILNFLPTRLFQQINDVKDKPGFAYSYHLGSGGYASFSLPFASSHSSPVIVTPSSSNTHQARTIVTVSLNSSLLQSDASQNNNPEPVSLTQRQDHLQSRHSVLPSHYYQTHFGQISPQIIPISSSTHSPLPGSVPPIKSFRGSRPDPVPTHLHPANNPFNPLLTRHPVHGHLHHQLSHHLHHHHPAPVHHAHSKPQLKPFPPAKIPPIQNVIQTPAHHPHTLPLPHHHHPIHPHPPTPTRPSYLPLNRLPTTPVYDPFEFHRAANKTKINNQISKNNVERPTPASETPTSPTPPPPPPLPPRPPPTPDRPPILIPIPPPQPPPGDSPFTPVVLQPFPGTKF